MERVHLDSSSHGDIGRAANYCPVAGRTIRLELDGGGDSLYHHYSSFGVVRTCRVNERGSSRRSFLQEALSYDVLRPRWRLPSQSTSQSNGRDVA